jgi:hypothetical protein
MALAILSIGLVGALAIFVAAVATHRQGVDQTSAALFAQKILAELNANLSDGYLKGLALRARGQPGAGAAGQLRRGLVLKDQTDPAFPSPYRYDLILQPLDPQRRDAYAVTLTIKWSEGGTEQQALFESVALRKIQ